jgi:hypothetical protein
MFPLHLAISHLWKVHYFTSGMADNAAHREEERRFLENMPAALGERAMAALDEIRSEVGLDYFGVDFALAADGSVLLFEANAAMVVIAPPPEPIWDYRRGPLARYTRGPEANGAVARPGWRRREVTRSIELRRSR